MPFSLSQLDNLRLTHGDSLFRLSHRLIRCQPHDRASVGFSSAAIFFSAISVPLYDNRYFVKPPVVNVSKRTLK